MHNQINNTPPSQLSEINQQKSSVSLVKQPHMQNEQINQGNFGTINKGTQQEERTFQKIFNYLSEKKIQFKVLEHEPTRTSEQSAAVRKTPLEWGAKTMIVSGVDNRLVLLIYRANRKVSWKKIRKIQQVGKKGQMVGEQQVLKLGVKPGGVPPFPHLIGIKGVLDSKFKQVEHIAFNAGHKCKSIIMKTVDFPLQDILVDDFTQE